MLDSLIINGTTQVSGSSSVPVGGVCAGVDEARELRAIEAESIGWLPLGGNAYLHASDGLATGAVVISVVGVPQDAEQGVPTLLLV